MKISCTNRKGETFTGWIDDEDAHIWLSCKWHIHLGGANKRPYFARSIYRKGRTPGHELLHRAILGEKAAGKMGDHKDGNSLNNARSNLRTCTNGQNLQNAPKRKQNKSGYKGVSWNTSNKKWMAYIQRDRKPYSLGGFDDPVEAAKAYDLAAKELHGDFAFLNFPNVEEEEQAEICFDK